MLHLSLAPFALLSMLAPDVREHPGGKVLPHETYVRTVSEADSPVQRLEIKSKDGTVVPGALRKPKGDGPFPVLIHFHGAPGGRGIDKLVEWSSGATGGPMWERFLKEGYVVVVADYRSLGKKPLQTPTPADEVTYIDDGIAVVDHIKKLPYVDPEKVTVYGVSLGGNLTLHLIGRTRVRSAILGAPAPMGFLGVKDLPRGKPKDIDPKSIAFDARLAEANIAPIACPVLIFVGTEDFLYPIDRILHEQLAKAGKRVRLEVYENGYHDFVMGPQGHPGRAEPLLDATLDALDVAVAFAKTATFAK